MVKSTCRSGQRREVPSVAASIPRLLEPGGASADADSASALIDFGGSGFDELGDRCRLRNIDSVAACVLDGLRAGALGHHPLHIDR
jgi:hypothetical protein